MFDRIMNWLFFVTAFAGLIGLGTIVILSEIEGPLWIAIMAAIGCVTVGAFALLLAIGLLVAMYATVGRPAIKWLLMR